MYASLAEVSQIQNPTERRLAEQIWHLQQTNALAEKRAASATLSILTAAKAKRDSRVQRLAERLPAAKRDKLLAMMAKPGAALSLGDDGAIRDPMAEALDIMESAALDIPAMLQGRTFTEQPQPTDGTMDEERRNAVVEEVLKNTGGLPAK